MHCGRVVSATGLAPDSQDTRLTIFGAFLTSKRCCTLSSSSDFISKAERNTFFSYDQGQVAQSALEFSILPNLPDENAKKICQDLAADILEYTARDLRSPDGGFYSAEDADSGESLEHPEKHIGEIPGLLVVCAMLRSF